MKKSISSLLAVVIVFSVLMPTTGFLSTLLASAASTAIIDIDFSESFYSDNSKVEQYNGARGKALRFDRVSISTETWGRSVLHKLGDENGNLNLPSGHKVSVDLEIRNEVLHPATAGGTDYRPYNIGIVYLTDTEVENARGATGGGLKTYADRIMKIAEVEGVIHSDFVNVSGKITVPTHSSDACAYLVLYADYQTAFDKTKVWIDNIIISDETIAAIDFSESFYSDNSKVEQYNGARGKALRFDRVSISTETWGRSVLHKLGDENGNLNLPSGHKVSVDLEIRNEVLHPATAGGTDYRPYNIGIVYLTDTEVENARGATGGGLKTYADRIMKIAEVEGVIHSDFVNVSGKITVPTHSSDACAYLVLYADYQTAFDKTKIWIDNIGITIGDEINNDEADNIIDFSDSYYDNNYKVTQFRADYGKSLQIGRISISTADWGRAVMYDLGDGDSVLDMPGGSKLTVSLELFKQTLQPATAGQTDYRDFKVGLVFLTDTEVYNAREGKDGGLMKYADRIVHLADVEGTISTDWESYSKYIEIADYSAGSKPYIVLYADYQTSIDACKIWIDNIKFEYQEQTTYEVSFETGGADPIKKITYIEGYTPNIPVITRSGYYFEGWFTDPQCRVAYQGAPSPARNFTIYAKWTNLDDVVPKTLKTGFEPSEYDDGQLPYTNQTPNENVLITANSDQTNTATAMILTNDKLATSGTHTLYFDNFDYENFNALYGPDSNGANAAAIFNKDGSNYKVVAGERYHINFEQYVNGAETWDWKDATITLVATNQMPVNGLNTAGITKLFEFKFGANCTDTQVQVGTWNHYEAFFESSVTGNLYMLMYAQNGAPGKGWYCRIDDFEIIPSTDEHITKMTFHKALGNEDIIDVWNGVTYGRIYGTPGMTYNEPISQCYDGKNFNGWVDSNGDPFTSDRIPENDIDLYPTYKDVTFPEMTTSIDWSNPIKIDFENTRAVQLFYGDKKNLPNPQRFGTKPIYNDPANAHGGNNYFSINKAGYWVTSGLPFKLYCDDTPGNYVWLDANSQYKITYYSNLKLHTDSVSELRTVGFKSVGGYDVDVYATETYRRASETDNRGWRKIEQILTVGSETTILGFQFWGGILTLDIDDITIVKLGKATVTFESNGGSKIESIETVLYDKIIEPESPTKEGFDFEGWYTDAALTKLYSFTETEITSDLKLYAKWTAYESNNTEEVKNETITPEKKYETVYETEYQEKVVENKIDNPELDETIMISGADTPSTGDNKDTSNASAQYIQWWVVVVIAVGVAVLAGVSITVIIILNKKKKKV